MSIPLLDVNVLVAMLSPEHEHYDRAVRWFVAHRQGRWATCPLTQAGFLRVATQPAAMGRRMTEAWSVLKACCAELDHVFWPMQEQPLEMLSEIRDRIVGHQQLTDAILLDLAIRRGGRLATLDRRIRNLLAPDSPTARIMPLPLNATLRPNQPVIARSGVFT